MIGVPLFSQAGYEAVMRGPSLDDPRDTPAAQAEQEHIEQLVERCSCEDSRGGLLDRWCVAHGDPELGGAGLDPRWH